ncbi:MAG: cotJA [Paenibacillus sp.]|nr:cotJA [Paenibacillus sp.]
MSSIKQTREYFPFVGPFDPCPPIYVKTYSTPPQLFIPFQPANLPQFSPEEALRLGTLWPMLYSPYPGKKAHKGGVAHEHGIKQQA